MKIERVETRIVNIPETESLAGLRVQPPLVRSFVTLEIKTDDGLEGLGVTFAFYSKALTPALRSAVDGLGALIVGDDPMLQDAILRKLNDAAGGSGPGGIFMLALSAIDVALWDIRAKALNVPLWKLLGGACERVPVYASGALQRTISNQDAARAARCLDERGFRQIKMQLGICKDFSPAKEFERARMVRDSVGPDVKLMADANQGWRVEEAIEVGRRLEELRFYWLEDLTAHDDFDGLARITAALATATAAGEYLWGIVPFRHMLEARSVHILIIDLLRVGGITQWMKVAGMAEAFNLRVVNHCFPEIQIHLVGAAPNGLTVEYMPWTLKLFEEVPEPKNGELIMPGGPGLGLRFDRDFLKRHSA